MGSSLNITMNSKYKALLMNIRFSVVIYCLFSLCTMLNTATSQPQDDTPLRIGIIGVVHGHVHGFLREAMEREDIELVGLVEANDSLLSAYGDQYDVPEHLRYTSLTTFLQEANPEALAIFSNTYDHTAIVEQAAPLGIHVMMEKPLAVNMEHAEAIQQAATTHGIHVLVNYETTWYRNNHDIYNNASEEGGVGALKKIVVHDGHWGPREIGVSDEFLEWLVDPVRNGGGALTDFGCYGANLMTWLMHGEQPIAITATLQQLKNDSLYENVDDEATIIVEYSSAQGIIQASWNWPYHRKDMEVYGALGFAHALNGGREVHQSIRGGETLRYEAEPLDAMHGDALSYLRAVIRGAINVQPYDLSALENNMMVTRILDAARLSAETGQRIVLSKR